MFFFTGNDGWASLGPEQGGTEHNDLELILTRWGLTGSNYDNNNLTSGFVNNGPVSEGLFIVKSLRKSPLISRQTNWPLNLKYMHFSNNKLSELSNVPSHGVWYDVEDNYGLYYTNLAGYDGNDNPVPAPYDYDSFTTSIKKLYPTTAIEGSLNTKSMFYINDSSENDGIPYSVKCKIDSYTFDFEHDLWSHDSAGTPRDLPAIVKYRDRYDDDIKVSHVQQTSFTINAVSTNIADIGSPTWKKEDKVFYETISDYTLPIGDDEDKASYNSNSYSYHNLDKYDYYKGNTYRQITSNYYDYSGSDLPVMLDVIVKTGYNPDTNHPNFAYGVSTVTNTANTSNFTRNELPILDPIENNETTYSNFKQQKFFRPNPDTWSRYNETILDDPDHLMCCPVLFSKLATTSYSEYGYESSFKSSANSYKNIFGLANLAAAAFGGAYGRFSIYLDSGNTYIISYAIDLRNISTTGAKAGKTSVSISSNSSDVLLIAHNNIYVVSLSQINNFVHYIY